MSAFEDFWRKRYPGCDPIGYRLREAGAANWIRFHSLPLSKRYAETDEERRILLQRQNALAEAVLGNRASCWLVQACWRTPEGVTDICDGRDPFRVTREHHLPFAFRFRVDDEEDDEFAVDWNVNAAPVVWEEGGFDQILQEIADERAAPTLWMSTSTGSIFAPYDGGVDLFLPDRSQVETLSIRHADWLSEHPSGL